MRKLALPIGLADFRTIREEGRFYVDKTRMISSLIHDSSAVLFTRPRRFGKTTVQTMLRDFFDIRQDSRALFNGLDIMNDKEAAENWMNSYPVIYLTLKDIDGLEFNSAVYRFQDVLSELFQSYVFLLEDSMTDGSRRIFDHILAHETSVDEIGSALRILASLLSEHYGRKVIILIDEYDVPLDKAAANGYYRDMLSLLRTMLSAVMKDNSNVRMSILTGCLRISKESLFTGLNNLSVYSVTSAKYSDVFGFTETEVSTMLEAAGLSGKKETIREWYDGYSIGKDMLYTPWDVLKYIDSIESDPDEQPRSYWANTSGNEIIHRLLDSRKPAVSDELGKLISGSCIEKTITENLTYGNLYDNENSIWSLMLETGYLTLSGPFKENEASKLRIPNEEVRSLFRSEADSWFQKQLSERKLSPLLNAIWKGDARGLSEIISDFLFCTVSYHDYSEAYYHAFLAGLLAASGYVVKSNRESGEGCPDILILDPEKRRAAVFELKTASNSISVSSILGNAEKQTASNRYGEDLEGYKEILRYCIVFCRKSAYAALISK